MQNKFITFITLFAFIFVTLLSPFPGPSGHANAQSTVTTGSLRLVTTTGVFSFKKDLIPGDTDPDVKELQKILNSSPDTVITDSGVGSPGLESAYFGNLTKMAVIKFQEKYRSEILTPSGLTVGNGNVGFSTRKKLNLLLGIGETLPSVGSPQSRASTAVTPVTSSNTGVCSFVNLLISIGAIATDKADRARSAIGCTTVAPVVNLTPQPNTAVCNFVNLLINIGVIGSDKSNQARAAFNCSDSNMPSVDIKANGSNGPITVLPGTTVKLRWIGTNVKSCSDGLNTLPTNGMVHTVVVANTSLSYPVSCIGNDGSNVVDSVTVIASNQTAASSTIQVLSSSITPGYDYAIFDAVTNIPTKMVIAYTNQPTATSSIKIYESATTTNHSHKITGLLPNTTYYGQVAFVASQDNSVMSEEITFTTTNDPTQTGGLAQRVLLSVGGNGIVSIPGSYSLKTEKSLTLEAWVKPTSWNTSAGLSNTRDSVIIAKGNVGGNIDYVLSLDAGKLVYSNKDSSVWTCAATVPLNKWTHVSATIDEYSSNLNLYVNGVKQTSVCGGPRGIYSGSSQINKMNAITEATASMNNTSTGGQNIASPSGTGNTSTGGWGSTSNTAPSSQTVQSLLPNNYASVSNQVTSNVYFGNLYPVATMCSATSTPFSTVGSAPRPTILGGNGFVGLIDNVKMWNVARTDIQIRSDASTSTATSTLTATSTASSNTNVLQEASLIGHWSFDDGRATDLSYNSNNGDLKGDMTIVDDETAPSVIDGSEFAMSGLEFNFPEICDGQMDLNLEEAALEQSGYEVTFKGGTKSVTASGQSNIVELETCDNPSETLVKSVKVIGNAPPRDASYYNIMGTISVITASGLGMKAPSVRDTVQGTALDLISSPGGGTSGTAGYSGANSVGYATNWQPQPNSCMKKPEGMFGSWAIVGAIVAVVAAGLSCIFAGCALLVALQGYLVATLGVSAGTASVIVLSATAYVGSEVGGAQDCDKDTVGCY